MIKSENKNSNTQFLGNKRELEEVTWDELCTYNWRRKKRQREEQRKTTERNITKKKSSE